MPTPINEYKRTIVSTERAKGINTAMAKIASEIFGSVEDISIEELAGVTGYSLATVSNTVKFLEVQGIIARIKKPGSKKVYVKAERDVMKTLIASINKSYETTIRPLKQSLPEIIKDQKKLLKEAKSESKKEQLKKELNIIENHLKQVDVMEGLFDHIITQCKKEGRKK